MAPRRALRRRSGSSVAAERRVAHKVLSSKEVTPFSRDAILSSDPILARIRRPSSPDEISRKLWVMLSDEEEGNADDDTGQCGELGFHQKHLRPVCRRMEMRRCRIN